MGNVRRILGNRLVQTNNTKSNKYDGGEPLDEPLGNALSKDNAHDDAYCIGNQHPACRAEPYTTIL